jgi:hypothetical protein
LTVFSARNRCSPICRLVMPSPISSRIRFSCGVRPASGSCFAVWPRSRAISCPAARGSSIDWPVATVRTAPIRSVPRICLSTYPAAPAMTASISASSSANEVSIRQATSGIRERISRQTVTPSPSGSRTSSTATSGRSAGILASADAAVPASPITSMSPSASSMSRTPRLTISWSSRRKTFTGCCAALSLAGVPTGVLLILGFLVDVMPPSGCGATD